MWVASDNLLQIDKDNAHLLEGSAIMLAIRNFMGFKIVVSRSGFMHTAKYISSQEYTKLIKLLLTDINAKCGKYFLFLYLPVYQENPAESFYLLQNNFKKISFPGSTTHSLMLENYIKSKKIKKELKYYKTGSQVCYSSEALSEKTIPEILRLHHEMRQKKNLPIDDFMSGENLSRMSTLYDDNIKLFCLRSECGDMLAYSLWYKQRYAYYLRGSVSTSDPKYHSLGYYLMDQAIKDISDDPTVIGIDMGGIGFATNEDSVFRFKNQFAKQIVAYQQHFIYSSSFLLTRLLRRVLIHLFLFRTK